MDTVGYKLVKVGPTYAPLPNVFQRLAKVVANASFYGGRPTPELNY